MTDFLFPAHSTKLETVGHFAIESVMGNLDPEKYRSIRNATMLAYEKDPNSIWYGNSYNFEIGAENILEQKCNENG